MSGAIVPGHVMTREHYERLAAQAAIQQSHVAFAEAQQQLRTSHQPPATGTTRSSK